MAHGATGKTLESKSPSCRKLRDKDGATWDIRNWKFQ